MRKGKDGTTYHHAVLWPRKGYSKRREKYAKKSANADSLLPTPKVSSDVVGSALEEIKAKLSSK